MYALARKQTTLIIIVPFPIRGHWFSDYCESFVDTQGRFYCENSMPKDVRIFAPQDFFPFFGGKSPKSQNQG